jgi:hypothetical protein
MARYQGMVLSGRAFTAAGVTASQGNVAALTAASAIFSIYNPIGSGVNIVLWKAGVALYATTAAQFGGIVLAGNTDTTKGAPTGTTTIAPTHDFLGNVMGFASKALVQINTTAITLTAVPAFLRPVCSFGGVNPTTTQYSVNSEVDLGGDYVLAPGSCASLHPVAAASSSQFIIGLSWSEIPLA